MWAKRNANSVLWLNSNIRTFFFDLLEEWQIGSQVFDCKLLSVTWWSHSGDPGLVHLCSAKFVVIIFSIHACQWLKKSTNTHTVWSSVCLKNKTTSQLRSESDQLRTWCRSSHYLRANVEIRQENESHESRKGNWLPINKTGSGGWASFSLIRFLFLSHSHSHAVSRNIILFPLAFFSCQSDQIRITRGRRVSTHTEADTQEEEVHDFRVRSWCCTDQQQRGLCVLHTSCVWYHEWIWADAGQNSENGKRSASERERHVWSPSLSITAAYHESSDNGSQRGREREL